MGTDSPKRRSWGRDHNWQVLAWIAAFLAVVVLSSACGSSAQTVSSPSARTPEVSAPSVSSASNASGSETKIEQDDAPAQRESETTSSALPPPAISAPAAASSVPANPYGPPSLDERIFFADAIAVVRPVSAEVGVLTVQREGVTHYSPVIRSRLEVIEYLKGTGGDEIFVDASAPYSDTYSSTEQALTGGEKRLAVQPYGTDGGEGVVFLARPGYPDAVSVTDTSLDADLAQWTQIETHLEVYRADGDLGEIPTAFRLDSKSAAASGGVQEFSIAELRERISTMESLLREGERIEGYEECIESKLLYENARRKNSDILSSVFDIGPFDSGSSAGSVVDKFDKTYHRRLFTGDNAYLFQYDDNTLRTTRPIPAGEYPVYANFQRMEWIPCDYVSPSVIWSYNFEPDEGVLHEAFFDPVEIDAGIGADSDNGVLNPNSFESNNGEIAIERIEWRGSQVTTEVSPSIDLSDHRMDFIVLDGSVLLRLDFDDANQIEEAGASTLTWRVCDQPWQDGDLLMLRIAESIPDDGVDATNDSDC